MKTSNKDLYFYLAHQKPIDSMRQKLLTCAKYDVLKHGVPLEHGGHGNGFKDLIKIHTELGEKTKDLGLILSLNAHLWGSIFPILRFGTAEQKKYLPHLIAGKIIAGHAITEPDAGSDISAIQAIARKTKGGYIINGHKRYITNAIIADLVITYIKFDNHIEAFIIKKTDNGVSILSNNQTRGDTGLTMGEIIFEDCRISNNRRLGDPTNKILGNMIIQYSLALERAFLFAGILGIMQWQFKEVLKYSKTRKANGNIIGKNQAISNKIVAMKMRIDIAKLLLNECATLKDIGKSIILKSAQTKLYISEAFLQSSTDAVQIMGAKGMEQDSILIKCVEDALASRIMSGTSEIQKNIISGLLGLK